MTRYFSRRDRYLAWANSATMFAASGVFMLATASGSFAQTNDVEFDVASVKRTVPSLPSDITISPGRFNAKSISLDVLIARAYGVLRTRIVGAPRWVLKERFEIDATMPPSSTTERINAMLRTLLEQRFRLSVEIQSRPVDVDVLGLADANGRLGPGLHAVTVDCETNRLRPGSGEGLWPENARLRCGNISSRGALGGTFRSMKYSALTMDVFANLLSSLSGKPVVNRTGLKGQFDIALEYSASVPAASNSTSGPSLNAALEDQLGLKLRKGGSGNVEFLVIRSVALPTEN